MKNTPRYKINYYYITTVLRTYPISFVSLFVLITAFFSWEELADVFDLIMIFLLFFAADFLMPYTGIKTPWKLRLVGAMVAEFPVVMLNLKLFEISNELNQLIYYLFEILIFISFFWFLFESWKILPNKIDWSGNSKIARSYRKEFDKTLKKDPSVLSKYFSYLWGRNIFSFPQHEQRAVITLMGVRVAILYLLAGAIIGIITLWSGLFFRAVDVKLSRFVILFIIVLLDVWNSYKERQYQKSDKEKPLEDDPHLSFIASIFKSKIPYVYLTLTIFNFITIFGVIFILAGMVNYLLKSAYIGNALLLISTEFNSSFIGYFWYIFSIIFLLSLMIPFLFYLIVQRTILENFARRHNNLTPLNYQKYQEILIFSSINYFFLTSFLPESLNFSLKILPIIIFSILIIINYKFSNKTPLTINREHIIWFTALPGLIIIGMGKFMIELFYLFILLSVVVKMLIISQDSKTQYSQLKKALVIFFTFPPFAIYFLEVSIKQTIIFSSFCISLLIIAFLLTKEQSRINALPPQKQKSSKWLNVFFGMGGPYTIEELRELGYDVTKLKIEQTAD